MAQLDELKQRLADIFGTESVPSVDAETLERYLEHLKAHLAFPCQVTGIEDFDWEEYYVDDLSVGFLFRGRLSWNIQQRLQLFPR